MKASKLWLCILAISTAISLKAQTNFKPGYYISASQDTVRGYIEYRSELRNYDVCIFRHDLNSKRVRLYPRAIKGYVILDKVFYETHSVKRKNSGEERPGFMQVLVRGKLSLLRNHGRFFAKDNTGQIFEITKKDIEVEDNVLQEDYRGIGYLKILMNDCPRMQLDSLEKQFQITPDFVEIFKMYYECVGGQSQVIQRIAIEPYVEFGPQASATATKIYFTDKLQRASFNYHLNPTIGGFASVFVPRLGERLRLVAEASFGMYRDRSNFSESVYYSDNETIYSTTHHNIFIDYTFVKVPLLARYSFGKVHIEAGTQYQFMFNQKVAWHTETVYQSVDIQGKRKYSLDGSTRGYVAGIGFTYSLGGYNVQLSFRLSRIKTKEHPNTPIFQTIEFLVAVQLR